MQLPLLSIFFIIIIITFVIIITAIIFIFLFSFPLFFIYRNKIKMDSTYMTNI